MSDQTLKIELRVAPQWSRVEPVREAVSLCVGVVYAADDLQHGISMTAAELMENAVKYGSPADNRVSLSLSEADGEVTIEVTNRIAEGSRGPDVLAERIAWIASFPSAAEAYVAAIAGVASEGGAASGLGLVRIAYEAGCRLSLQRDGDLLTVRAHYRVTSCGGSPAG
jgi:hypothetical protein